MQRSLLALTAICALGAGVASAAAEPSTPPPTQPPPLDAASIIRTDESIVLKSNAEQTLRMPIKGLGVAQNTLAPCFGFEIKGPGVKLAAADLEYFGATVPEPGHENDPDGGVRGAVRQADGTFVIPSTIAKVRGEHLRAGATCAAAGWDFSRAKASARGRQAKRPAVTVTLAGLEGYANGTSDLVVKVRTGRLTGRTTLTGHAGVLPQGS